MKSAKTYTDCGVLIFMACVALIRSQITWTERPEIRMGQTSIYDDVYIPLNQNSQVTVTYKSAFPASANTVSHQAVAVSGFENYLHFQISINVTIFAPPLNDHVKVNIYVGAQTYIKQLNINYFIMKSGGTGAYDTFIGVSVGNYIIPLTAQPYFFNNESSPFPAPSNIKSLVSTIHGIDYSNTEGVINEVKVETKFNPTIQKIQQQVSVGQKGKLNFISITTILIREAFYNVNPNAFITLGYTMETRITNGGAPTGLDRLMDMNSAGLFSKDNVFFFGMRGFKFKMQQTRLFLLTISTQTTFINNLKTNAFMEYVQLSSMMIVDRACPTGQYFYLERFKCMPVADCTANPFQNTLVDASNSVCRTCHQTCLACTSNVLDCVDCAVGSNRLPTGTDPLVSKCICDPVSGYVEVDGELNCQKCSDIINGCQTCTSKNFCTACVDMSIMQLQTVGADQICICQSSKYLVNDVCLSYPGCKKANKYITGQFCQDCDSDSNFQKNLANNSSCVCKVGYEPTTDGRCIDICGDSKTPDSPVNATETQIICDDGNNQSGDGCSSSCRQQFGYVCKVDTPGGISNCAQKQQIQIKYLYSEKNLIGNQGVIIFALLPPQSQLAQNTFQSSISTNIPGSRKIKFDPVNSLIMITVDYPETLQGNAYEFNFTFAGLKIHSEDIKLKATLNGINAKLSTSQAPHQTNIITYLAMGVSAFALGLALISSFLGQKMMGIQLILPCQAAFFTMATLPQNVLSPISALWSLKFSNGYNSIQKYDLATNYMLDNRITIMQYSGQFILNYNIMFSLLTLAIIIMGIIVIKVAWLEHDQRKLEEAQKKKQEEDKDQEKNKSKDKSQPQNEDDKETEDQSKKEDQTNLENIQQELEDVRQNIKNWKNFLYMIFDRFFSILVIISMMKVIFCFYIQLSNLNYTAEVYDNSINAGFFFIAYATIIAGLYSIIYDYKTDKLIVFTCNKGKYAIFYITIFVAYIVLLGALFQTFIAVYISAIFCLMPIVLILYQIPYGLRIFDFQAIIAVICQLPFLLMTVLSLMLNLSKQSANQSICYILAFVIIGSIGLSIILTIVRLIKIIDCKKVSCVQFTDRKKDNPNDKNKKKNKVALLEIDMDKDWDEEGSVREVLYQKSKNQASCDPNSQTKNKNQINPPPQKDDSKNKDNPKNMEDQEDDEDIDELEKIKMKLRKDLKQKKAIGKVK